MKLLEKRLFSTFIKYLISVVQLWQVGFENHIFSVVPQKSLRDAGNPADQEISPNRDIILNEIYPFTSTQRFFFST